MFCFSCWRGTLAPLLVSAQTTQHTHSTHTTLYPEMRAFTSFTAGPRTPPPAAPRGPRPPRADKMCRDVVSTPKDKSTAVGSATVAFLGAGGVREDVPCAKVREERKGRRWASGVPLVWASPRATAHGKRAQETWGRRRREESAGATPSAENRAGASTPVFLIPDPPTLPLSLSGWLHPGRRPGRRPGTPLHLPRRHLRRLRGARGGGGGGPERRESERVVFFRRKGGKQRFFHHDTPPHHTPHRSTSSHSR